MSPTLSSRSSTSAGNGWNADVVGRFDIDGERTRLGLGSQTVAHRTLVAKIISKFEYLRDQVDVKTF